MMLDVPRETLRQRLMKRWAEHGKSSEEIGQQVDSSDMLNVDLIQTSSRPADYGLRF
jgi:pantothenate kinase